MNLVVMFWIMSGLDRTVHYCTICNMTSVVVTQLVWQLVLVVAMDACFYQMWQEERLVDCGLGW